MNKGPLVSRDRSYRARGCFVSVTIAVIVCALAAPAAERHMMQPRVPQDQLAEARALHSPLSESPEVLEQGKALYEGKGTCFNCHGKNGGGDGMAAKGLNPPPRNFRHHGFWRHRTEGEIFWVIKHGSPGTGMVGFGGVLTDEEIWTIIQYERSFAGTRGPMHGRGPQGMQHGSRGGMGMEPHEGQCCDNESQ